MHACELLKVNHTGQQTSTTLAAAVAPTTKHGNNKATCTASVFFNSFSYFAIANPYDITFLKSLFCFYPIS